MRLELVRFDLPLRRPLVTAFAEVTHREGILVGLTDGVHAGWGEVCPMPDWSLHELPEIERLLRHLEVQLENEPDLPLASLVELLEAVPAARAAMVGAIADWEANAAGLPLAHHLSASALSRVRVNATITERDITPALSQARKAVESGIDTLKVKVAHRELADDVEILRRLRREFGSEVALRLDANGGWSVADALVALEQFAQYEPVYCEEPTSGVAGIAAVGARSSVPVAIDESARDLGDINDALRSGSISAVIVKPQAVGGCDRAAVVVAAALASNVTPVITSMIDSAVGVAHAVHFAASSGVDVAHGLATSDLLAVDVAEPLMVEAGEIRIPESPGLGLLPRRTDG